MADENLDKHWSSEPFRDLNSTVSEYEAEVPPANSLEQSVSEANSYSLTQKFPKIVWKLESHYRIHKSRCHQQIHSKPFNPISLRTISILPFQLHLGLPSSPFPSRFITKSM